VDRDLGRASALAAKFGGARAALPEALADIAGGVQVVHVCTPLDSHEALTAMALSAGAHVLVEKPLASTAQATAELLAIAARAGRLLVPVHQFPFQRGMRRLGAEMPTLGALRQVDFTTFTAGADGRAGSDRRDVLLEILPHPVALLRALGLRVATFAWQIERFDDDVLALQTVEGTASVRVRIDLAARPTCNELRVAGERGTAQADLFHGFCSFDRATTGRRSKAIRPFRASGATAWAAGINLGERALRRQPAYPGLPELITAFYAAAERGLAAPIDSEECMAVAELRDRIASCLP
jgi:predicted dehydrogenase